jgi:hypothetical protein
LTAARFTKAKAQARGEKSSHRPSTGMEKTSSGDSSEVFAFTP